LVLTAGDAPSGDAGPDASTAGYRVTAGARCPAASYSARFYAPGGSKVVALIFDGPGRFFVMMMLSGAGPPFDVMTGIMRHISDILPLTYVTRILQTPWLGTGLAWRDVAVALAIAVAAAVTAWAAFRWE
jgi:hypothetical protein